MPAALVRVAGERALVLGDYHAGIEAVFRYQGLTVESRADDRREAVLDLIERTGANQVVFLGDLAHAIGEPRGAELAEIQELVEAVTERVSALLVKGNHDGKIEDSLGVPVASSAGVVIDGVGFVHGHTIPAAEVVAAEVVCVGHEHVTVRMEDEVGGRRLERAWLRGRLDPAGFSHVDPAEVTGEVVFFPAFNDLVGGTWVNVPGQEFLAPFMPEGMADGELYLLDGTRLGPYQEV